MSASIPSYLSSECEPKGFVDSPWIVAICLVVASLACSVTITTIRDPAPNVHDEFSYLLAADTFCAGRLANPVHPYWQHFETFHVIQQPSYASKYPPGQGLFLALGQWLAGRPIVGVWILSALAAAATYWMLLGWTSPCWAAIGSLLWLAHPGYQLMWGQSFWGGTLAYLGGALVCGAALRVRRRARVRDAAAMAMGTLLLAVSRPFEGLVFCVLIGGWVIWHWLRFGVPSVRDVIFKLVLPQAAILAIGGACLAAYHHAVTGDPLTLPYVVHERAYAQCPVFHWQTPTTPNYSHATIAGFHSGWAMDWYRAQSTLTGWLRVKTQVVGSAAAFFFPAVFAVALLLAQPWRSRRLAPVLLIVSLATLVSLAAVFCFPHYLAPVAPLLLIIVVTGLRHIDAWAQLRPSTRRLVPALVALQVCIFLFAAAKYAMTPVTGWTAQRSLIASQLLKTPGKHLVIVRYGARHSPHEEWVYNRADIDGARIVWAREGGEVPDAALRDYFADRQGWLLEPESQRLSPLPLDPLVQANR